MSYCNHFAQTSRTAVGDWLKWRTKHKELVLIRSACPDQRSAILEIGPGKGELAELLRRAGYNNYRAVEPNAEMREHLIRRKFQVQNYLIPYLQEPDNSCDLLILIDVFEHLSTAQDAETFIGEAYRVLRPNGKICIAAPDYLHWGEDFFNCDYTHNNVTTVRRTFQLFYSNGFRTLNYTYFSGAVSGAAATLLSNIARFSLSFSNSNGMDMKFYKLKLTLLRRFIIIGAKVG